MIFENLRPYEQAGISEAMIMQAFRECHVTLLVEVKNHTVRATLKEGTINGPDPNRPQQIDWIIMFFQRLAPFLPDTRIAVNSRDEPCSWTSPIPAESEAAYQAGRLSLQDAWLQHGCDGVGMARMKQLHGFFVSPATFPATRSRVPVWSIYSIPSCFGGGHLQRDFACIHHCIPPQLCTQ